MITHVSIRDFAIIEAIELDFEPGLTVITGETGAGKSIIIEAVSLALGSRADTTMVRSGRKKAAIQLVLEHAGQEHILSREISAAGKSISKIDGEIVPLSRLAGFAARLVDIHGQYDHQSLFDTENHLKLVDAFHAGQILPQKERVAASWKQYIQAKHDLQTLLCRESSGKRQQDYMRFELDEIEKADPRPGELEALREQLSILQNGELIHDSLLTAHASLTGESGSATDALGVAMKSMQQVASCAQEFQEIAETLSDCFYRLEDTSTSLRSWLDRADFSPETLNSVLARIDVLERLLSKYGGSEEAVLEWRDRLQLELLDMENLDERKAALQARKEACEQELIALSLELQTLRKASAAELEKRINQELETLNFHSACFAVRFRENRSLISELSENGIDFVEFLISANRGQPLLPLARVVSGGEMSRMMLAFKSVIGDYDRIPTLIFDEIDNGISGITASVVGEKLLAMAGRHQIICITHLPQITAFGAHHYLIRKAETDRSTLTDIVPLDEAGRIREVARLLGGANITETTLASAEELIALSQTTVRGR